MTIKTCVISGCERVVRARGWCGMHYMRWLRHGNELQVKNLTDEQVREIRDAWRDGTSQAELGRRYQCGRQNINTIINRRTYRHVD